MVFELQGKLQPIEIKSGATFVADWLDVVRKWVSFAKEDALPPQIIYGGDAGYVRQGVEVIGCRDIG